MASFYSKPADYGTYTQATNLDLVNFVMSSKQQKYDYNLAKVESKIKDQLGSIDLERAQDKEYFLNKASEVLSSIGDTSKLDWSKNGVTRQVDSQINTIVDDRVLNDTISTRNYRSFQKTLQAKQSGKNPELYSAQNAAYAMDKYGVNEWLQGNSDKVGSITYEDYVDVGSELKEISENLPKYARVFERPNVVDGGKYLVDEKGTVLTPKEVRAIAEAQLSSKAKRQMQIDGWASYDGGSRTTAEITKDFSEFATADLERAQANIDDLEAKISNLGTNDPKEEGYTKEKAKWEEYKTKRGSAYKEWIDKGEKSNMTTTLHNENVFGNFGNTFAINNISISNRRADDYMLASFNNKLAMQRDAQKQLAASNAAALKAQQGVENPYQVGDRTILPGQPGYTEVAGYTDRQKELQGFDEDYKATVNGVMQTLRNRDAEFAKKVEDSAKNLMETQGLTREAAIDAVLEDGIGTGKIFTKDLLKNIETARRNRNVVAKELDTSTTAAFEQVETEAAITIANEFSGNHNPNIKVTDLEGNLTTGPALLRKYNITEANINDPANAEIKEHIVKNYYAQAIIEAGEGQGIMGGLGAAITAGATMNRATDFGIGAKLMQISAGEDEQIKMMKNRFLKLAGGEQQAAEFLAKVKEKGAYDTNPIADRLRTIAGPIGLIANLANRDNALSDDNQISNAITASKVKAQASKLLNQGFGGAKIPGALLVRPGTPQVDVLKAALNSPDLILSGGATGMFDANSSVTLVDIGGGVIRASVMDQKEGEVVNQYVTIPKSALPPEILAQVNFETEGRGFTVENMTEVVESTKLYSDENMDEMYGVAKALNIGVEQVMDFGTIEGFRTQISAYSSLEDIGTPENPGKVRKALTKMVEEGDLRLKIIKVGDRFHNSFVKPNKENGKDIGVFTSRKPIDPSNYQTAYNNTKYGAQIALGQAINRGLSLMADGASIEENKFINNILQHYGESN